MSVDRVSAGAANNRKGNDGTLSFVTTAAAPGTIILSGQTAIVGLSGAQPNLLSGKALLPGLQGGTLSVSANILSL